MFNEGFNVISKSRNGWTVLTTDGKFELAPAESVKPPVKKRHRPKAVPVRKETADRDLVPFVEEIVSDAVQSVMRDDSLSDIRQDVAGLSRSLDAAGEALEKIEDSESDLRDGVWSLLDRGAAIMKFAGIPSGGVPPMNVDDAVAASLARRRGR